MTGPIAARRGQPLLFLGSMLIGWVLLRITLWEPPWPSASPVIKAAQRVVLQTEIRSESDAQAGPPGEGFLQDGRREDSPLPIALERPLAAPVKPQARHTPSKEVFVPGTRAMGHNLLWLSAMAGLPVTRTIESAFQRTATPVWLKPPAPMTGGKPAPGHWRVDGWLFLRDGAPAANAKAAPFATYGGSQAGAVISYRLAPGKRYDPAAYVRASHALVGAGESEVAAGVRVRPIAPLPLVAHAELRATDRSGRVEMRPAAFLSGGFTTQVLPIGMQARAYAQSGFVGGDFATAFVDGALAAERPIARTGKSAVMVGAGVWGGAQKGAARLDIGPSLAIDVEIGAAPARIAADWRWRVAGNAQPGNGAAITLSTGF